MEEQGTTANNSTRILLIEDHASFRQALALMLEREPGFSVAAQAGSLSEARESLEAVDVAVVDLGLPDGSGTELLGRLRESQPRAMSLVLTASVEPAEFARAVEAGASGVMHKSSGIEEIVAAVRRLSEGEMLLSVSEVIDMLSLARSDREKSRAAREAANSLTAREREVLQGLAGGLSSKEIARKLYITVETERTHMVNILAKLGVHSRMQALVFAVRNGIVEIG